jgi:hypothetical protein
MRSRLKMEEVIDLLKDYKDCTNYISNFNTYNPNELSRWVDIKYADWIAKNPNYVFSANVGGIPPKNEIERVQNKLNNFKVALEKIALIEGINLN